MLKLKDKDNLIAYFSMEIGVDPEIPTYAGGLGVLSGDILRSFADQGVPALGVTLLSEFGYFTQEIADDGAQTEYYHRWDVDRYLEKLSPEVTLHTNNCTIYLYVWQYLITGLKGEKVPIIFLDSNHPQNPSEFRKLTQRLYPANPTFRFLQEIILGMGGVRALQAIGMEPTIYHMNEGHSSLLTLELLKQARRNNVPGPMRHVRKKCVFTTHTPVEAGHDRFSRDLIKQHLGDRNYELLNTITDAFEVDDLNMTRLALSMSSKMNGVAHKHAETSRKMFPKYNFSAITNGVHHTFWASPPYYMLFDEYLEGWQNDAFALLGASNIPAELIGRAHHDNKVRLIDHLNKTTNEKFDANTFTIGYARRFTKYKRPDLIFYDLDRIKSLAKQMPIQIVFAGKAHPNDLVGKSMLEEIVSLQTKLKGNIKIAFIKNYNLNYAKMIIPGVDIWLNTPMRPLEASGTSGMKASLNGVPNFSVLDGWWLEGHMEGVTGWSIGPNPVRNEEADNLTNDANDAEDMYNKLENQIVPMYYNNHESFVRIRRNAIGLHGSYFNTHRVVQQYLLKSYLN